MSGEAARPHHRALRARSPSPVTLRSTGEDAKWPAFVAVTELSQNSIGNAGTLCGSGVRGHARRGEKRALEWLIVARVSAAKPGKALPCVHRSVPDFASL